jgi:hypothetical protein
MVTAGACRPSMTWREMAGGFPQSLSVAVLAVRPPVEPPPSRPRAGAAGDLGSTSRAPAGCGSGLARRGHQADDWQLAVRLALVLREAGRGGGDLLPGLRTLRPV